MKEHKSILKYKKEYAILEMLVGPDAAELLRRNARAVAEAGRAAE